MFCIDLGYRFKTFEEIRLGVNIRMVEKSVMIIRGLQRFRSLRVRHDKY